MITAERYHDISVGHRVTGHENKCRFLHGHNYRMHFVVAAPELDALGRVMDFSVIKSKLCMWLEEAWDHKFLIWEHDELKDDLIKLHPESIVVTPFNPTAENIAKHLCEVVAIDQLSGTGCVLIECRVEETRKCLATYKIDK
jgi:6-pyruvoyltetrahydropterin/6-carboxytetrahydropterin synthase